MAGLDFSPISNAPENALRAAAMGDALQESRYQNRLLHMAQDRALREQSVADTVAGALYGAQGQPPAAPPVNMLAPDPQSATPVPPANGLPQPLQMPGSIYGQMAAVTPPAGPGAVQTATPAPVGVTTGPAVPQAVTPPPPPTVNPYDKQRLVLRDLYNSGRVTAAEAQRYDEKITEKELVWKEQQAKQRMDQLKLMAEEGKIDADKAKLAQSQMEPVVRAMSPILAKRDKLVKGGMDETKANEAVQPDYEQMLTSMAEIPGFEKAAKDAPRKFSPTMAYALKDTYAALEKAAQAKEFTDPYKLTIGGKPVLVQTNTRTGEIRKVAEDKSTTVVVKPGGSGEAPDAFSKWSKQDKEWWFENMKATGQKPDFGWGKSAGVSRAQFSKEYAQWAISGKISGADAATEKATFEADKKSLGVQTKALDASKSFIKTIDNNINQLEGHIAQMAKSMNMDRNRLLNMGTREFNKKLIGNSNINIYDMLVAAISTENAKLQAGGAGSVAQVAEGARAEMAKIHDNNLPVSEMLKLMKATRQEGGNRIKGIGDTVKEIQQRMRGGSGKPADQRISTAARRIASDMRGNWSDPKRQQMVYENLKKQRYTDEEIGQAFAAAKGGQ